MEFERTSMAQFSEIERLIQIGQSDRKIAKALGCRRTLVAEVRKGKVNFDILSNSKKRECKLAPGWALRADWESIEKDIREGHQIKRIWEESSADVISYPTFFKYVKARFSNLLDSTITLREFKPGEYCEVDYAGDKIEWITTKTGEIQEAHVFVGILCFSQKLFAFAAEDEKKRNWLDCHRRMFEFFGGATQVLVPDQLKNGVIKSHLYDPDLNPDYVELAAHYGVAVVPARSRHPRDKALVENAVGILMRYFRFIYRKTTFTSLSEINQALEKSFNTINRKIHSRFKTSRQARFEDLEKAHLKVLPIEPYSVGEWKIATIHPDCTIAAEHNFYSAPYIHRGKKVRVKISKNYVEIFLELHRIALHDRAHGKVGERVIEKMHLPPNSRAYLETTPQLLLAQAKFSHVELHRFIDELFQEDALGNLRRAQGLVRKAYSLIQSHGHETSAPWIATAISHMRRFNNRRVKTFEEIVKSEMKKKPEAGVDRSIRRQPGNPMVRGHGSQKPAENEAKIPQTQLRLV
jgi:transposase